MIFTFILFIILIDISCGSKESKEDRSSSTAAVPQKPFISTEDESGYNTDVEDSSDEEHDIKDKIENEKKKIKDRSKKFSPTGHYDNLYEDPSGYAIPQSELYDKDIEEHIEQDIHRKELSSEGSFKYIDGKLKVVVIDDEKLARIKKKDLKKLDNRKKGQGKRKSKIKGMLKRGKREVIRVGRALAQKASEAFHMHRDIPAEDIDDVLKFQGTEHKILEASDEDYTDSEYDSDSDFDDNQPWEEGQSSLEDSEEDDSEPFYVNGNVQVVPTRPPRPSEEKIYGSN